MNSRNADPMTFFHTYYIKNIKALLISITES